MTYLKCKKKKHHYIPGILHLASLSFKKWRWNKDIFWLVKLGLVFTEYYYPHILNFLIFVLLFLFILHLYQSVQFSHSVLSDSLQSHGLQHARPNWPSPTPRTYSKHMSGGSVMPSNHLMLCCPLLLPPSVFSNIKVFSSESVLHIKRSKYWSFSFSISPSNEYSGLISFRMDWLDLLTVQWTLRVFSNTTIQKASILWRSDFFRVQLSHPYMSTWKTRALTRWNFVAK